MRKLTLADIKDTREYERERDDFRRHIIELKTRRRIPLGTIMTIVFENTDTMRFQVQEMARAERMMSDEQIEHEIETYNTLIPGPGELSATLLIELQSEAQLREWLPKLVGIQRHVAIALPDGSEVRAVAQDEERLTREDTTPAVHFLNFAFTAAQVDAFAAGAGAHRPRSPRVPRGRGADGVAAGRVAGRPAGDGVGPRRCRSPFAASIPSSRSRWRNTKATRGWISSPGKGQCSRPGVAAPPSRPASRSRSRRATPASCNRARDSRGSTASRASTRPASSTRATATRSRVLLVNTDPTEPFEIKRGDRIAQLVIQRVERVEWHEVETLDDYRARARRLGFDRRALNAAGVHCRPWPTTARFRFGLIAHNTSSGKEFTELARRAEATGFSTLFVPDHFVDHELAPTVALAHAAAVTDTLRIGPLVLGNDYKHPVVLAREVGTLDLLSNGRLELGIGAGWMTVDYEKAGIPLDSPGVRIARLAESIAVLKGLLGDGPFTFEGEYYRVTDLDGQPKPVQRPHPPFIVGGGGPKILALAAREAADRRHQRQPAFGRREHSGCRPVAHVGRDRRQARVVAGRRGPPFRRSRDPDARRVRARRRRHAARSSTRSRARSVSIGTTRTWRR